MAARAVLAVLEREVIKLLRQRGRLASAMVRPLLWLIVIGGGFGAIQSVRGGVDYQSFLVPGVLGMTLLFGGMLAALSTMNDKESGVMRMLVIAPVEHYWIVIAKAVGATAAAVIQALLLIVILGLLGYLSADVSVAVLAAGLVLTGFACASLGMLVAAFSRTLDNYATIMNMVIFPVFFLSGSLYPVRELPPVLQAIASVNPFTHGVDLIKHSAVAGAGVAYPPDFTVGTDLAVLVSFSVVALAIAAIRFSAEGTETPLIQRLASRR